MTRVIQLTDIHFGGEDVKAVEAAMAYVLADPPALTVLTGDLTLNGLPKEFRAAANWIARLPGPVIATPGNHDTPYWNIPLRALIPFARYRRHIGAADGETWANPTLSVAMLNTARGAQPRPDWSKGAVNLAKLEAAADVLAGGAAGALRVLGCHHPLVEAVGAPVTGGVHRGEAAAKCLAERRIDLILTGHVHNPFAVPLPYGDQRSYAVGGGTLSLRTRGTPASFNVLCVEDGCVQVTAMGWTGGHFEPWRTWALPRREPVA